MERSVLITGCSSGIGLDAARTLRARGWRVLATCRKPEDVARLAGDGFESFPLELADERPGIAKESHIPNIVSDIMPRNPSRISGPERRAVDTRAGAPVAPSVGARP